MAGIPEIKRISLAAGPHSAAVDYRFMRQTPAGADNRHKKGPPFGASTVRGSGAVKKGQSYTPVPSLWVLKFNHRQFTPLVKKGDKIKPGQIIGLQRRKIKTSLNLARRLKVDPVKVRAYLLLAPGAVVARGEILARKKSLLGSEFAVTSPQDGQFRLLSKRAGWVSIVRLKKEKVPALLSGEVTAVHDDKLTIRFVARVFPGKTDYRRQQWGELMALAEGDIFALQKPDRPVFLLLSRPTLALAIKARALGVKAIISPNQFPNCPLPNFIAADYNALLALAGQPALLDGRQQRLLVCQEEKN